MASYIVLVPPLLNNQRQDDKTVFVRDGFAILAFFLPVPWLLFNRLWFEAALVFAAVAAISVVGTYTDHAVLAEIVAALLALLVAFEASNWRIKALERRGFDQAAIVDARSAADAETAYFYGGNFVSTPAPVLPDLNHDAPLAMSADSKPIAGGMLGLVGYRGER
ncbi:DUF2628 domain-containing protein [Phyllobacterium sp. OV277]|jgi:hypothetical protein|uniref:DUF2628 domain-containing protein n=1 Tax=Phyllobacterium sp. OV277 TaxID=1882772 RepID=UPI00088B7303|nr:DUF2628 domain-containing protein [Phyllobacterium sp. OV277]SDO60995.1 Protein of unknown function [Phyllobacterium sp. OV277]